jgi:SAM-dependent methyltransferase
LTSEPLYVCGHSPAELERLSVQALFYEEITRSFLEKAGLGTGMRVLDIGCGAGDVSFTAARLVGPSGFVLGVDRAAEPLSVARLRARALGLAHLDFQRAEIRDLALEQPPDALVGRFVLMHQADPRATLRHAARLVRPGGIVAFLESDLRASLEGVHSRPHSRTYARILESFVRVIEAAGAHPDLGLSLGEVFALAGLPAPRLWLQARVEGGPEAALYRYVVESLRSMAPQAESLGLTTSIWSALDRLEEELRNEVVRSGGVLVSPLVVGAWCRLAG